MTLRFEEQAPGRPRPGWAPALGLATLWCAVLAALELADALPLVLWSALLPLLSPCLPRRARWAALVLLALGAGAWLALGHVGNGLKLLANQTFTISESCQAYEYDYFTAVDSPASLREALAWLGLATGLLAAALRFWAVAPMGGLLLLSAAYFGVTPGLPWLLLPAGAAALCALPRGCRRRYGPAVAAVLVLLALAVQWIAPAPNAYVSGVEEQLRDRLALHSVYYERTPEPVTLPEPETESPPPAEAQQPGEAARTRRVNVLLLGLVALTLVLLFVPAVIQDRARKRREWQRADFSSADCALAVRAMYLHSRKWRRLLPQPPEVPPEIEALWLEAAYSSHPITEEQRALMAQYLAGVEQSVRQSVSAWERLRIKYRLAL